MREESGRNRVALDEHASLEDMRAMLRDPSREEIVMRENVGREGAEAVERLARSLGLHFKPYGRGTNTVLVVSKTPLPDYRADLDARRNATRDVEMSDDARRVVAAALERAETHRPAATKHERVQRLGEESEDDVFASSSEAAAFDAAEAARERTRRASPRALASALERARLPAAARRDAFLEAVAADQVTVVSGETGCGKTTQCPQFVLERALAEGRASATYVVCTQPRRISAVSVAARVAHERGEAVGATVGYRIRLEARVSRERTRLEFCTTGVLLRRLAKNPTLRGVSHVFVDEIHERGMHEDFLLIVLKDLLPKRPDLRVVLMSATMDAGVFANYFGVPPGRAFHIPGFTHPVREAFLEDLLAGTGDVFGGANAISSPVVIRDRRDRRGERPFGDKTGRGHGRGCGRGRGRAHRRPSGNEAPSVETASEKALGETVAVRDGDFPSEWSAYAPDVVASLRQWTANCAADDALDVELVRDAVRRVAALAEETERREETEAKSARAREESASAVVREESFVAGAVLVFLTGWDDIVKVRDLCASDEVLGDASRFLILPLHGQMPSAHQREIFDRPRRGARKVILATNIAETSITIDDVVYVVDCGKSKEKSYDALNDMACLLPAWISKASARQRRGRAGRVRPGVCVRLYTRAAHARMADHAVPEMLRAPLEELVLAVKSLSPNAEAAAFAARAIQPPPARAVANAIDLLVAVGALRRSDETLTALGAHLVSLPVAPRLGKMLVVAAALGQLEPALTVAAATATRGFFVLPLDAKHAADASRRAFAGDAASDHVATARAFEEWRSVFAKRGASAARAFCRERFLSRDALERVAEVREQLRSLLRTAGFARREPSAGSAGSSHDEAGALDVEVFRAVACAGLFPKIAAVSRRGRRVELRTHEDGRVEFHPGSVNAQPGASFPFPWVVYGEKVKTGAVYLRDSTCVPACAVLLLGGELEAAPLERDAAAKTFRDGASADDRTRLDQPDQTLDRVRVLNGAYAFVAPSATLDAIKRLRTALDATLREKAENPAVDVAARGAALVGAVRALMADEARASAREAVAHSKNSNPRDWPCPRGCGVVFAAKKRCFRCGAAKPEAAET
jgi:ATP-dependent RNA helicase DHX36